MKIVVLDGYTENPGDLSWGDMEELGELTVYDRTSLIDMQEVIDRIGDADAVITNKTPLPKEVFEACRNIRYVGVLATGYNVVDVDTARREAYLSATFQHTVPPRWDSLPLPCCWKSAIISAIMTKQSMREDGKRTLTGASGIIR